MIYLVSNFNVLDLSRALKPMTWLWKNRRYDHPLAPNFHQFPYEFHPKLDIPLFDGRLHIEEVDNCFAYMEIPEHKRVYLVRCKLTGGALAWWEKIQAQRRREGRDPVCSWSQMRCLLRGLFLPKDFEQTLYRQYRQCHQKLRSVNEYTEEFYRLSSRVDLQELELQLTTRFIMGLRDVIKDKLLLHSIWNLNDTANLAYKVEEQLLRSSSSFTRRSTSSNSSQKTQIYSSQPSSSTAPSGSLDGSSPTSKAPRKLPMHSTKLKPYAKLMPIKCYCYQQPSHLSNEGPQRRHANFADEVP